MSRKSILKLILGVLGFVYAVHVAPVYLKVYVGIVAGFPLGYIAALSYARWQARVNAEIADAVVKELRGMTTTGRAPSPPLRLELSRETVIAQMEIVHRLRQSESVIARSKLRFLNRPTQEDIQAAIADDALIVVRVPVPERWRSGCPSVEAHRRVLERCNAILRELDLTGGHPRVMLLADTCDSVPQFREKVWENFSA